MQRRTYGSIEKPQGAPGAAPQRASKISKEVGRKEGVKPALRHSVHPFFTPNKELTRLVYGGLVAGGGVIKGLIILPFKILKFIFKKGGRNLRRYILICAFGAAAAFFIWAAWISRDLPDPDKLTDPDRAVTQSTKIYERSGERLLYEIFNEKRRTLVELKDIPDYAVEAMIAIEDKNFYSHKGVRWLSVVRAAVANAVGRRAGGGGASTITQQLIKNAIVGNERSLARKIKEAVLATRLEKKYSKEEILKLYFNEIPYGSANYGIEAASQSYFGKSVKDITLAEAAALAALPKAPTRYLNDLEALTSRRNYILDLMVEQEYIDKARAEEAKKEGTKVRKTLGAIQAPHFSLYVKELLTEKFGEKAVETEGLKVITTLSWDKQQIAEEVVREGVNKAEKEHKLGNGALVAIDPQKGEILAMVGSRDFFDEKHDGQVNVALRLRQPGSSLKPFIYLAGFEKGYTADTILYDVVTNFDATKTKPYVPHNYDQKERGPVSVREALQMSINVPAVKMTYLAGVPRVLDFLERLHYSTFKERARFGLSIVLGGGEVKLLEHTAAYAALAADGVYREPTAILRVENSKGETLFDDERDATERREGVSVIDKNLVHLLNSVLTDDALRAPLFGVGSVLTLPGRAVAAKTGTTNDYRDGWLMGYTPSLAAGVWVGNNDNTPMNRAGGSLGAGPIWNAFMRRALEGTPVESFPAPPENDAVKPVLRGVKGGGVKVAIDSVSGKLATSSTPKEFIVDKIYLQPHDILHYVYKDDPRGPIPDSPQDDPQYDLWENAIQEWLKKQEEQGIKFDFGEPPAEFDDVHSIELAPRLVVLSPASGARITDRTLRATVDVSAPRGVQKVRYFVDGAFIAEAGALPFALEFYAREFGSGPHTLTISAYDPVGNVTSVDVPFTMDAPPAPPDIIWKSPRPGSTFFLGIPLTFTVDFFRGDAIVEMRLSATRLGDAGMEDLNTKTEIASFSNFGSGAQFIWKPDAPGTYILTPEILGGDGVKHEGNSIKIIIRGGG